MKTSLKALMVALFIVMASTVVTAQQGELPGKSIAKMVSDKGFWVIEKNIKSPKNCMVHFYTTDNTLMYSEKVDGIKLDAKKRKTVTILNKALLQTLLTWQQSKLLKQNEQLVKNMLQ